MMRLCKGGGQTQGEGGTEGTGLLLLRANLLSWANYLTSNSEGRRKGRKVQENQVDWTAYSPHETFFFYLSIYGEGFIIQISRSQAEYWSSIYLALSFTVIVGGLFLFPLTIMMEVEMRKKNNARLLHNSLNAIIQTSNHENKREDCNLNDTEKHNSNPNDLTPTISFKMNNFFIEILLS